MAMCGSRPAPVYDANNNMEKVFSPNGTESSSVYDEADQVTASLAPKDLATDPERRTTTTYDKVGNVKTVTEPKGNVTATIGDYTTTYAYNEIYQPVSVVDAKGPCCVEWPVRAAVNSTRRYGRTSPIWPRAAGLSLGAEAAEFRSGTPPGPVRRSDTQRAGPSSSRTEPSRGEGRRGIVARADVRAT